MDIAPVNLIDLVLILLIFFITTTTFLNLKLIELTLPTASAGDAQKESPSLVISIDRDGALFVDREALEYEALAATIRERIAATPGLRVLVAADAMSRHERFVSVLATLKSEKIANIGIVTEQPRNALLP